MLEVGCVESLNEKRGTAKVVFDRKSACDKCRMCLTMSGEKMKVYVEVKNTIGAKVGDKVGVAMNDGFVLKAAFIVYLIPVLLVGIGLAVFRKFSDLILFVVVGIGLLLGIGVGIFADRMIRKKSTFSPTLVQIFDRAEDEETDHRAADEKENAQTEKEEASASDEENAPDEGSKEE